MTNENSLIDKIMAGLRSEVERFVAGFNPAEETLDQAETASRNFATACGAVAQTARVTCMLEAQCYVGPQIATPSGGVAFFERYEQRWVLTHLGRLRIRRAYYWDPHKNEGFIPLDERWDLDEREPSPALRRSIGMVSAEIPFMRGRRLVQQLSLVELAEKRLQESGEAIGEKLKQIKRDAAEITLPMLRDASVAVPEFPVSARQGTLYVQMDGGRLNTTTEGWREPKVATVYWGDDIVDVSKDRRCILHKEYVAVLGDADELAKRLWEVACRWKWWTARRVVVLGDGAPWIWNRAADLFPDAIQILDRYHAEEHIWAVARQLYGGVGKHKDKHGEKVETLTAKDIKTRQWAKARVDELEAGDVAAILKNLRQLRPKRRTAVEAVDDLIEYIDTNRDRMKYDKYVEQGLTVGSGTIESGIKNVVNQRMKGCGMRWAVDRAENMLHLRAAYLSDVGVGHQLLAA
jgi:hypothetical protein